MGPYLWVGGASQAPGSQLAEMRLTNTLSAATGQRQGETSTTAFRDRERILVGAEKNLQGSHSHISHVRAWDAKMVPR